MRAEMSDCSYCRTAPPAPRSADLRIAGGRTLSFLGRGSVGRCDIRLRRRRTFMFRLRQHRRTVLVLRQTRIHESKHRGDGSSYHPERGSDRPLLRSAPDIDAHRGLQQMPLDLDGRAQTGQADLLRLTLDLQAQLLRPELEVTLALDEHILGVERQILGAHQAVLDIELRNAATDRPTSVRLGAQQ